MKKTSLFLKCGLAAVAVAPVVVLATSCTKSVTVDKVSVKVGEATEVKVNNLPKDSTGLKITATVTESSNKDVAKDKLTVTFDTTDSAKVKVKLESTADKKLAKDDKVTCDLHIEYTEKDAKEPKKVDIKGYVVTISEAQA